MSDNTALPEAPASANFRLTSPGGVTVQWTLRDASEGDLYDRVKGFIRGLVAEGHTVNGVAAPAQASAASEYTFPLRGKPGDEYDPGEHVEKVPCPVHPGLHLYRRANENGFWYSHKCDDGGYCNGTE